MRKLFIIAAMSIYLATMASVVFAETPDELMKTAVQLYQNSDYDLAAEQFQKYVSSFPSDPHVADALYGLAESDFAKGSVRESLETFEKLLASYPASEKAPDAKLRLGDCHYILKEYGKAVKAYKVFLDAYPDKKAAADALYMTGYSYIKLGDFDKAAEAFSEAASKFPDSPKAAECSFMAGESYDQKGDFAKARGYYLAVVAKDPDGTYGQKSAFRIGEADFLGGNYEEAKKELGDFLLKHVYSEDAPAARLDLGDAYFKTGSFDEAITQYDMFINKYSASELLPEAEFRKAESYYQKKDYAKAKEIYTEVLAKYPDAKGRDRFLYGLGWSCFKLGDMRGATENFGKLAEKYPDSDLAVTAYLQLGEARARMKDYGQAADAYKHALANAKDPSDIKTARYDMAWAYYQAKMFKEAEQALLEMLADNQKLDPQGNIEVKNLLARCRLYRGDYPSAISGFKEIADKYPKDPLAQDALLGLAEAYERHGDPYKAIDAYQRLLKNYPESKGKDEALFGIGRNYLEQGNFSQAVEGFTALLSQVSSPKYQEDGLFGLAESCYGAKDYPKAMENYASYIRKYPGGSHRDKALYGLAWSLMGLKEYQGSYDAFIKLSTEAKDGSLVPEAILDAGEAMYDQGKYAEAETQYKDVLAKYPDTEPANKAVYALAWTELKLNNAKDAEAGFEEFSKANPKDPLADEADYQRGLILIQQGETDKGTALLKSVADKDPSGDVGNRAKLALAKAMASAGDQAQAQALLDQLKKSGSGNLVQEAVFQQAYLKFNQQSFAEAQKLFEQFVQSYPGSVYEMKARYFAALSAVNLKDYEAAAEGLKKVADSSAQELKPGALYWYADSCYNLKKYQDALDSYESFISKYQADKLLPEAEYGRAWALDKLGRTADAENAFKSLATKYPDGPHAADAWYKVGEYGMAAKDWTSAADAFTKFVGLNQDSSLKADASFQLGEALEALNRDDEAVKAYSEAEAAGGRLKAPSALHAGKLLAKAGKWAEACAEFDTATLDNDFAGEALLGEGKAFFAQKKYDEAMAALGKAADHPQALNVRAESFYIYGECSEAKSNFKAAIIAYTECLILGESPYRADSMLKVAESYVRLGEKDKAATAYKNYLDAYPGAAKAPDAKKALEQLGKN